jgi:hypothetical protein
MVAFVAGQQGKGPAAQTGEAFVGEACEANHAALS